MPRTISSDETVRLRPHHATKGGLREGSLIAKHYHDWTHVLMVYYFLIDMEGENLNEEIL